MGICSKPDKASKVREKNAGDQKITDPVKKCPLEDANIVSIHWLDGGDDILVATATQWVNLPKADKWVNNDEIKNKDRLGLKPRIKVKFDKPGRHSFKVKLVSTGGTDAYTDPEKGRNGHFKYTETESSFSTDDDGTKIIDGSFDLVAGGGYKFKAEAKDDKGKKVSTGDITTKRLIYYVEAKMTGLGSVLGSTSPIDTEFAKHHIVAKKMPALSIARMENIGSSSDTSTLATRVNTAVDGSAAVKVKKPYLLTVAYTDHLAVKNSGVVIDKENIDVGPGKPKVTIPVTARGLRPPNTMAGRKLWHDIVTGESWFVEAKFHKNGGGVTVIPADKVVHKGSGNYWTSVEVDVAGIPAGRGKVEVKVNVVDRMRGGLALGGANQVCVCTRAWWATVSNNDQAGTIIHEMGHKVQMVTAGTGSQPDRVATQYLNKGHVGNHCHKGCAAGETTYGTTAMLNNSTCVMFGTVNGTHAFCDNCEKAVKKVDIASGW